MTEAKARFQLCFKESIEFPPFNNIICYELGWCAYLEGDYKTAISKFE